jgi:hypothetical protein
MFQAVENICKKLGNYMKHYTCFFYMLLILLKILVKIAGAIQNMEQYIVTGASSAAAVRLHHAHYVEG